MADCSHSPKGLPDLEPGLPRDQQAPKSGGLSPAQGPIFLPGGAKSRDPVEWMAEALVSLYINMDSSATNTCPAGIFPAMWNLVSIDKQLQVMAVSGRP